MRKRLILWFLAATVTAGAADSDTLTIVSPKKVTVITADSLQRIKVYGREGDENYTYESSIQLVDSNYVSETSINKDNWSLSVFNRRLSGKDRFTATTNFSSRFGLGLCSAVGADEGVSTDIGSSWELFWTILEYSYSPYDNRHEFSAGLSLDWRNYRMTGYSRFVKGSDGRVGAEKYPDGYEPDFSRIKVFSLSIPLMWHYRFARKWSFGVGPVLNFNTYASIKSRYRDAEGRKHKDVFKHIHQRPFTVGVMAELNILNQVNLYCKYTPMSVLSPDYAQGTCFQSLSFGVYL